MRVPLSFVLLSLVVVPSLAFALTIAPADVYHDVQPGSREAAGINLLTSEGIVRGYGNGFFGTSRMINRAEFLVVALRFHPNLLAAWTNPMNTDCFPDVHASDWFRNAVCYSLDIGLVSGYSDGLFHPERPVTYGEALKILTFFFFYDLPGPVPGHWAETFYQAAVARGTDLPVTITLDTPLTRGRAARLAAAFLAESHSQLDEFRRAESGQYDNATSSSVSSSSSSFSSSQSSSSFSSSVSNRPLDPLSDTAIRSQFLLLGETGPIVAAANIFMESEPLDIRKIGINVNTESTTLRGFVVYDENRRELGKATLDPTASTNRHYTLSIAPGTLMLEKRTSFRIYIRPILLHKDLGGLSNESIQVGNIIVQGNGGWSSQLYTQSSTETFPAFVASRSAITSVTNALSGTEPLVVGPNRRIGAFRFEGRRTDASAHLRLTDLVFTIGSTGGAALTNVKLRADGTSDTFSCTVSSSLITCSSISDTFGSLNDGPRTLSLYADISITDPVNASLQISLNDAGSPVDSGSVTWTDGTTSFDWIGLDSPLARGTYYKY